MSTLRTRPRRWERLETRPGPTDPALAPPIVPRPSAVFRIHRYVNISLEEMVEQMLP